MDEAQKDILRKKAEARWRKTEKYAAILDAPKLQVYENLALIDKYSKQIRGKIPYYINLVFREGKWSGEVRDNAHIKYEAILRERQQDMNQNQNMNQKKDIEDENEDPIESLKLMLWTIKKIGSLEKAEKLFQAAKIALKSMEIE